MECNNSLDFLNLRIHQKTPKENEEIYEEACGEKKNSHTSPLR
jgi:hypothetical protein